MNHHIQNHKPTPPENTQLETRLTRALDDRVAPLHFTPEMRSDLMQRISKHHHSNLSSWLVIALVCLLLLFSSSLFYIFLHHAQPIQLKPSVTYAVDKFISAPNELAQGGQLISLDPTGQHLVYQSANQPGVMYMTDLADPIKSNILVMRYAHDVTWAPDGSALITTVSPEGSQTPLLALVPQGKYMYPLGHEAEASSWLPTSVQNITYSTHSTSQTNLWSTTPTDHTQNALATMNIPLHILHMAWSPKGQQLAMVVSIPSSTNAPAQQALYLMNAQTKALQTLIPPTSATLGAVTWSADENHFAYTQTETSGRTSLQIFTFNKLTSHFSLPSQHTVMGWSWSPDSKALVYSDGGKLTAYTLQGPTLVFPATEDSRVDPFWLPNGNLLYLQFTHGVGKLAIIHATKGH